MITKIWYHVLNCGDGSAYPEWVESLELAEICQEIQPEGWGESCTGCIEIEHDSHIKILNKINTVDDIIEEVEDRLKYCGDDNKSHYQEKLRELYVLKAGK